MEDVLAVYTRPRDPERPLVCLDETSKQLIAETRVPIPMKPGRPARLDYEYERNGTANLFMMFAPLEGWRHVKVTDRHTAVDYAHVLKDLADTHFPHANTIVLVQDNLNIHSKASLYEVFPAAEARTPAVPIGRLKEPLDLGLSEVLSPAKLGVGAPPVGAVDRSRSGFERVRARADSFRHSASRESRHSEASARRQCSVRPRSSRPLS